MKTLLAIALIVFALSQLALSQKPDSKGEQTSPPSVKFDPSSVDFGDQVTKKASKYQRITVTNTGGKKLYVNSVVVSGDDRQNFALVGDTCTGSTIEPSKSCVVDVCFTPSRTERHKAAVEFTDNATDSPQNVPLTGKGINSADVRPGADKQRRWSVRVNTQVATIYRSLQWDMSNEVLPFFWFAAQNDNLKRINRSPDRYSARHNYDTGNVIACSEAAAGVGRHRPAVVSDKDASGFGCPGE